MNNAKAVRSSTGASGLSSARGLVATVAKGLFSGQQFIEREGGRVPLIATVISPADSSLFCFAWFRPALAGFGEWDDLVLAAATETLVPCAAGVKEPVRSGSARLVLHELCAPATTTVSVAWSETAKVFMCGSTRALEASEAAGVEWCEDATVSMGHASALMASRAHVAKTQPAPANQSIRATAEKERNFPSDE